MEEAELEQFIEQSFRDGYSIEEIKEALREEKVERSKIQEAIRNLRNRLRQQQNNQPQNPRQKNRGSSQKAINSGSPVKTQVDSRNSNNVQNSQPNRPNRSQRTTQENRTAQSGQNHRDIIGGVDLTGDSYKIKQRLLFNRYHIYDSNDNLVLKAKQKMFKLKEDFPFMNSDGETVFRAKGQSIIDVAGDYAITDENSEEPLVVLDRKYTLFRHKWRIRDPNTEELLARVESRNKNIELLRWIGNLIPYMPNVFGLIPHSYDVKDRNDNLLARLEGKLSIRDVYELNVKNSQSIPKEALVASSIAIDALEAN